LLVDTCWHTDTSLETSLLSCGWSVGPQAMSPTATMTGPPDDGPEELAPLWHPASPATAMITTTTSTIKSAFGNGG
jgi:hypothetical protein